MRGIILLKVVFLIVIIERKCFVISIMCRLYVCIIILYRVGHKDLPHFEEV